ncbi:bromodomain adjacent to zinc finger domain protein 2A isoform X1 [Cervus canadensis]|uniref:bromodomain adjacent to zinc finger domain protein 2A isoform X1 n=2 Tax=Cervus canadensis TaxID=1574408 RepID=UPI0018BD0A76|nr:bromodomain adjacent to zinc finger domain protein 2A isoform X1 [Cervus canadensis]XP_043303154.1 bromodomain adjacent to zinc finger domain protein 2A isoform X1 [Cervus canadensis]XP_043303155.1 bromodomain adjacent to zinc finger domain protein 2A isoform X1 [Cervus canadensis]XP_043303156.1 bromodomain adjacent to zinc finger domain protein 2A isoform X1 [Cervus canadensis]
MEANDHFNFTGLPPAPAASGLKPSPSSGEGLYTNGSPMNFPQQGKSLNGDVNVNGLSTVSHTTTSGILNSAPHSSSTSHLHHPNVAYDCLWNYSQYSSANPGSNLKDPPLLSQFSGGQYPLNGILGGSRQPSSPSHNTNLRAGSQEFWANGTQSPMGLNFDSQELYDSFPDQNFEIMPNGPPSFFTSPQTSPMLGSSIQTFAPSSQEVGSGIHPDEAAEKELTSVVAENGAGLVGSLELEEEQPELKMCGYNGSVPSVESLHQEVSVLVPDPTVSCLDDPSHLPDQLEGTPILSEVSLESFSTLAPEPVSGGLYGIDDTELMGAEAKLPLEDSPVISALDCPSLNNATAFSLLADDSQTSASIFASPTSPPVLGESVLQDNSFDLNNGSDAEQEEMETQAPDFPPLTQPAPDQSSTVQLHPATSPAVSPTASSAVSLAVSPAASPEISPQVSLAVSTAASPEISPAISPAAFPAVSPASSAALPPVSSEVSLTASPVTSPKASPAASPAAVFPTASPADKDISSVPETTADLEDTIVEGVPPSGSGDVLRRRIATPEEVRLPLQHGWRREVRIKKGSHRWQGETWYYGPCGKRMKQFPEVIKYLSRNVVHNVRREHFSFSPRMPVGDFFEERDTPEGLQWVQLSAEEIPSRIQAITGKRGRPRNTEKAKTKEAPKVKRGRGRPPKVKGAELLSKTDTRLLRRLEAPETLNEEDKAKMCKVKKKIKQKVQRGECQTTNQGQAKTKRKQETKSLKQKEAKKKSKAEKEKVKTKQEKLKDRVKREKKEKVKTKEKEAAAKTTPAGKADKVLATQRRLEERQRQQMILEEMKRPTEDMCLPDHQPLPDFSRIPGLLLPSGAFSDCLTIVEFLHSFGKVLGFDPAKDVPSLGVLQEGLLCQGGSSGEVQDLLVRLLKAALCDPGLPCYCQSLKILGEKVSEIPLTRDNVSEILRCFLMAYGVEPALCDSLRTQPFQAQPPQQKAAVLAFLVHELNGSTLIINEIDKTLESMSSYRKNKWIVEGRLRRLKTALAKRTGRPELELQGPEEGLGRRRSPRVLEETSGLEEEDGEEAAAAAVHSRRARRDAEVDITAASIPELERQIEKLSKRQLFFRKKLLHSSQMLRAVSLGQDRYRRRYWVLPCLTGIFVEGAEGSLVPEDVIKQETDSLKVATHSATSPASFSLKRELAGSSTSASSPARARGRPRKTKPGSMQPRHLKSPSKGQGSEEPQTQLQPEIQSHPQLQAHAQPQLQSHPHSHNGFLEPEGSPLSLGQSQHDLSQSAFLSWLSQTQNHGSLLSSSVLTPDSSPGKLDPAPSHAPEEPEPDETEASPDSQAPWFNFSAQMPCIAAPTPPPAVSEDQPTLSPQLPASSKPGSRASAASSCSPGPFSSTPLLGMAPKRRAGDPGETPHSPAGQGQPKRRGRPPSKFFKQMEQRYLTQLTAQPVPPEMRSGWWWIRDPETLDATLQALHPRGIREKALHKHLSKHRDLLQEVCLRPAADPIFEPSQLPACEEGIVSWTPKEKTYETDLAVLQWVEELERRVILSDLQIRGWTCPSPDSTREDLAYCEHLADSQEDITWRGRGKEGLAPQRKTTNPLDLAVTRLAALEQNVERRYLREPLWPAHEVVLEKALLSTPGSAPQSAPTEISYEITPRVRAWRQTLERCRSAAQVCLCLGQLERSIAWEKSVNRVTCLVCRKGDNDEFLLLCDGCDRGCHIYCLRPKMEAVPEGDWFCAVCLAQQVEGELTQKSGFPKRGQKRKSSYVLNFPDGDSRRRRLLPRGRESPAAPRCSEEGLSPLKRRRVSMRNHHSDLTFCEIILMEMESHDAAWPFLEPVNPRLVSGYRRIIKNPMDFSTMRERLLRGGYASSEEFAADALLVFDNCQTFNEDDSEVGRAGHTMRRFFESRWEEFYQGKQASL